MKPEPGRLLLALALSACLSAGLAAQRGEALDFYDNARLYELDEQWFKAVESYLEALRVNPAFYEAARSLATCYFELGEYDQALSWSDKAGKLRPGSVEILSQRGFILLAKGDLKGAGQAFTDLGAREPNNVDARFGFALIDLAAGKTDSALKRYQDALRLSPLNARALISLALIYDERGQTAAAQAAIEESLRNHGNEVQVQYFAAYISARHGAWAEAERRCRSALDLSPGHQAAQQLLGTVLDRAGKTEEALRTMEVVVAGGNRKTAAWYLLGRLRRGAGKTAEALSAFKQAVSLSPDDELARLALERLLIHDLKPEDQARQAWADYHAKLGADLAQRNFRDRSLFEYRRALLLYPYSAKTRLAYADILKRQGRLASYIEELKAISADGAKDRPIDEAMETYSAVLRDSLSAAWDRDQFALDKRGCRLAIFHPRDSINLRHVDSNELIAEYLGDILSQSGRFRVLDLAMVSDGFADAFKRAREAGADYFAIIDSREGERDVSIEASVYVGRTGSLAGRLSAYRSGNDRVKGASQRIVEQLEAAVPQRGFLVERRQREALISLGSNDGVSKGDEFIVVKKDRLRYAIEGFGLDYGEEDVLASVKLSALDEELSQGSLQKSGFFDMANAGDEVIRKLAKPPETQAERGVASPALFDMVLQVR